MSKHLRIGATLIAPSLLHSQSGTIASSSTWDITPTNAPTPGNLLVIIAGGTVNRSVSIMPDGMTEISWGGSPTNRIFYKIAGGSEPATYTITWGGGLSGNYAYYEVVGVDTTSPVLATTTGAVSAGTSVSVNYTVTAPCIGISGCARTTSDTWAPNDGFTVTGSGGSYSRAYKIFPAVTSGTVTYSGTVTLDANAGLTLFRGKTLY